MMMTDVRAGSLAAVFCLVYNLSHYKKQNSQQSSQRPLPSNQRAPVTMPSRYSEQRRFAILMFSKVDRLRLKMMDWKVMDHIAGVENAGPH